MKPEVDYLCCFPCFWQASSHVAEQELWGTTIRGGTSRMCLMPGMIQSFQARCSQLWLICPLSWDPFTAEDFMQNCWTAKKWRGIWYWLRTNDESAVVWWSEISKLPTVMCAVKPWLMEELLNTGLIVPIPKGRGGGVRLNWTTSAASIFCRDHCCFVMGCCWTGLSLSSPLGLRSSEQVPGSTRSGSFAL